MIIAQSILSLSPTYFTTKAKKSGGAKNKLYYERSQGDR